MAKKKSKNSTPKRRPAATATKKASFLNSNLLITGLLIGFLGFLLYANTFSHEYALDDSSVLADNWVVQKGVAGIPTIFTTHYRYGYWNSRGTLYRPMALSLFAVEWSIAPDSPGFYHFVNVLLYALSGLLLFIVLSRILKGYSILLPFIAAILFIAHPIHTEIVANIKSADEILAFLFTLASLWFLWNYLEQKQNLQLGISLGFYTLAMFSKESVVTFLAVIPLMIWFFKKKKIVEVLNISAFYLVPVVLLFLMRVNVLGSVVAGTDGASRLDNLLAAAPDMITEKATAFALMGKYLLALFFPYPLVSDVGFSQFPIVGFGDWQAIISLLVYAGLGAYALSQLKNKSLISFGILFYLITFSLFSNLIVMIGSSYGERFLYIPSLGFTLVIAVLLMKVAGLELKSKERKPILQQLKASPILMSGVGALLLFYSFQTISRNPAWKNSYTLYSTDVKTSPNSAKLRYHHGLELAKLAKDGKDIPEKERLSIEALREFDVAIELHPPYHDAFAEKGLVLYRMGQKEQALENYRKSIEYKDHNAKVYSNMGIIYIEQQNYLEGLKVYQKAVELDPRMVDARRNLGVCHALLNQYDQAIVQFKEGLKYADSQNKALLNFYLGSAYRDKGDASSAAPYLEEAYRLNPSLKPK